MKAVLLRTGSVPVLQSVLTGSPKVSLSRQDSVTGIFSGEKNTVSSSPRISLHLEANGRRDITRIRRASSDSDLIRSGSDVSVGSTKLSGAAGSRSFPPRIPEDDVDDCGALILKKNGDDRVGIWPESGIPVEELEFSGNFGGDGYKNGNFGDGGGGGGGGGYGDKSKIGDYYKEMLKLNPGDSLLLRNYGKYLHEVEKDTERAEEYYGRAILASPGDGEVLSLYGELIWETHRDRSRAKAYFDQAVYASPNDCMVLGSYAHFMWEAEEEEEDEEIIDQVEVSPAMVAAF